MSAPRGSGRALVAVKVVHTLTWISIEACVVYLLAAGIRHRSDRRAAVAGAIVVGETVVFAANGFRCPLSDVAEALGADRGSVTDLYLPRPVAHSLPVLHAPVLVVIALLHARNLREQHAPRPDRPRPDGRGTT